MTEANISRPALLEAIASLESQRGLAGNDQEFEQAVRLALSALREKLARLESQTETKNNPHLAVLVADLSGFTALSEYVDAEKVRDALNAMWLVLDEVIHAWGGRIDQHAGDSLLALFGLPTPGRFDIANALQAALAIQLELSLFNQRARAGYPHEGITDWVYEWPSPSMRIGVHAGPIYFAQAPGKRQKTAVGDTILVGRRLEKLAPAGQVLASGTVYRQAQSRFQMVPLAVPGVELPSPVTGRLITDEAFLVLDERPGFHNPPGEIAGRRTRLVGRTAELDELQLALQTAVDSRSPQLINLISSPGMGKSRLVHEFVAGARSNSESLTILSAEMQQVWPASPFALVRDLLVRRLGIRAQHSLNVKEAKLHRALERITPIGSENEPSRPNKEMVALLLQLLDAENATSLRAEDVFSTVRSLLRNITADSPAILILDKVHLADRQSLDLIDQLLLIDADMPLLIFCVFNDTFSYGRKTVIPWLDREDDPFSPAITLDVPRLTPVEARLVVSSILSPLAPVPMRLIDLIVAEARGNPLYIEEFVRLLIEQGLLSVGDVWHADLAGVEALHLPAGLEAVVRMRASRLPEPERSVLLWASAMGLICWDDALIAASQELLPTLGRIDLDGILVSLENRGFLHHDPMGNFSHIQSFAFNHQIVRDVLYDSLPEPEKFKVHRLMVDWLRANQPVIQAGFWLPVSNMIAWHQARSTDLGRFPGRQPLMKPDVERSSFMTGTSGSN